MVHSSMTNNNSSSSVAVFNNTTHVESSAKSVDTHRGGGGVNTGDVTPPKNSIEDYNENNVRTIAVLPIMPTLNNNSDAAAAVSSNVDGFDNDANDFLNANDLDSNQNQTTTLSSSPIPNVPVTTTANAAAVVSNSAAGSNTNKTTTVATTSTPTLVSRKLAIVGSRAVGESCMIKSFISGAVCDNKTYYDPTIESSYHRQIRFRRIHFYCDIVDTAGMDEHSRLSRNASLGCNGFCLVFSLVSRQSFLQIRQINEILLSTLGDAPYVPRVLVGTMKDLVGSAESSSATTSTTRTAPTLSASVKTASQTTKVTSDRRVNNNLDSNQQFRRQVSTAEGQALAKQWNVPYVECSASTGEGVSDVFHTLLKEIEKQGDDGLLQLTEPIVEPSGCIIS